MLAERVTFKAPQGVPLRMVADYIDRCRAELPALHTALDGSDFEHMRIYGHRLRGTGGAYGFPALTEIGGSIEQAARARDEARLRKQIAALEAFLCRVDVVTY